jgi:hypothetical protein
MAMPLPGKGEPDLMGYDKHDYSCRAVLYELLKELQLDKLPKPFTAVDVGCGFGLRYTGDVLHGLAMQGITAPILHLVDPTLYGWAPNFSLGALGREFTAARFRVHSCRWDARLLRKKTLRLSAAFAIQATTLFSPDAFEKLHRDLSRLLVRGGYFADVSELKDRVTDPNLYRNTRVYSRTETVRETVAKKYGLEVVKKIVMNAHATYDGQKMCGILFRRM